MRISTKSAQNKPFHTRSQMHKCCQPGKKPQRAPIWRDKSKAGTSAVSCSPSPQFWRESNGPVLLQKTLQRRARLMGGIERISALQKNSIFASRQAQETDRGHKERFNSLWPLVTVVEPSKFASKTYALSTGVQSIPSNEAENLYFEVEPALWIP